MSLRPDWLRDFASNTFSQGGEDGVIAKSLSLLPARDRWCVEFGAWDGIHLSNVRRLILEENYSAVLIEASSARHADLVKNYAAYESVHAVQRYVGFDSSNGLDTILQSYDVPLDFDFLSVDIDGNDYYAWEASSKYRPKLVCIEFNPTIPTEVRFVQQRDPQINQGSSLLSLCDLAKAKGYELVAVLPFNALFVDGAYYSLFQIADNDPLLIRRDTDDVTWFFSGFDGTVHLAGARRLPWHDVAIDESRLQVLPRPLRKYPDRFGIRHRLLFRILRKLGKLRR